MIEKLYLVSTTFYVGLKKIKYYTYELLNALSEVARGLYIDLVGYIKTCSKWTYNKKSMQIR